MVSDFVCWRCIKRKVLMPGDTCRICDDHVNADRPARSVADAGRLTNIDIEDASLRRWQELTGI